MKSKKKNYFFGTDAHFVRLSFYIYYKIINKTSFKSLETFDNRVSVRENFLNYFNILMWGII